MKKLITLIFGILIAVVAICQTPERPGLAYVYKLYKVKQVDLKDSLIFTYRWWQESDSALALNPGVDTFDITIIAKKVSKPVPQPKPDIIVEVDDANFTATKYFICPSLTTCAPAQNLGTNVFSPQVTWNHMYNNSWNQNHYQKTISTIYIGGHIEVTQMCSRFEWWSEKRVNHGIAAISVDGGAETKVDLFDNTTSNGTQKVWDSGELGSTKVRTIKIRFTGEKNIAASEFNWGHDKLVFITHQ